jgi:hypothetical protein
MQFAIERWDSVIVDSRPVPVMYIPHTPELKNKKLVISIHGTDSCYDGIVDDAIIQSSTLTGGYRPNFNATYHLDTVIPLHMEWQGYPKNLGFITFDIQTTTDSFQYPETQMNFTEHVMKTNPNKILCCYCITAIIIILIIRNS